jgi:hypothetical protein
MTAGESEVSHRFSEPGAWRSGDEAMHFKSYSDRWPVNQIEIFDADGSEVAIWLG